MGTASPARNKAAEVVEWAHDFLGLTWEEVGATVGTTGRTVQRWRDQANVPGRESAERLDAVDELRFWIETVFEGDRDSAHEWLHTRLVDLKGKTPMHTIKAGEVATISEFLATFHAGAFI
jgi:hypothetical protein